MASVPANPLPKPPPPAGEGRVGAGPQARSAAEPDPRLHAYRPDLADARLRGLVPASCYTEGKQARIVVGSARLRRTPSLTGELDNFCHYGETLLVFDEADGFVWCQSQFDRY